jgi:two-component system sensor histidine kinase PilS (NtrC family)
MGVRLFGSELAVEPAWRTLEYFALARVLVASALVLSVAAFGAPLVARGAPEIDGSRVLAGSLAYFVLAAGLALVAFFVRRRFVLQVAGQLAVDLAVISAMLVAGGGLRSGVMILYLLPLAGASLLLPTVAAFFVCSIAVIVLLADTLLRQLQGTAADALVFQAGLYGAALFAITGLLRLLSARLAAQERLAQLRGRDLESQLEINRLVIAQMEQGVIVVDADTRVRANNRAARALLGMNPNAQLTGQRLRDFPSLRPLTEAFARWLKAERTAGVWSNSVIQSVARNDGAQAVVDLQLRARFARPPSDGGGEFVIFLEDVRALEERAQQLKLAAMGRLTASIAHEIRNPLAAISHAGQLLAEEAQAPLQQRLTNIVRENTARLNRLVEDVLRVARREPPLGDDIDLGAFAGQWLAEFIRDRAIAPGLISLQVEPGLDVKFEQSHLRQILYNLVDNALRYASGRPRSVELIAERAPDDGGRVRLWVFDDGPGIAAEARNALFEPFYTTHARGTGLGLYIAREFCLANRSDLVYGARRELDGSSREGFLLRFARTGTVGADEHGFLDTMPVR